MQHSIKENFMICATPVVSDFTQNMSAAKVRALGNPTNTRFL
jgi:hypothetical protein